MLATNLRDRWLNRRTPPNQTHPLQPLNDRPQWLNDAHRTLERAATQPELAKRQEAAQEAKPRVQKREPLPDEPSPGA